ncbi:MAG: hypothetical protein Kow0058_17370 [Roseovarius sp.]
MTRARRYLFPLPEVGAPVGGVNVLLQIVTVLRAAGREALPVYASPGHVYEFWPHDGPAGYDPALAALANPFERRLTRLRRRLAAWPARAVRVGKGGNQLCRPGPDDAIVAPEYCLTEIARLYPHNPIVLAAQDAHGLALARHWDRDGAAFGRVAAAFATSQASAAALGHVFGGPAERITLPVARPGLEFAPHKRRQIAYMPRKRPEEAGFVVAALRAMPELAGWEFVEMRGMSSERLVAAFRDAALFISFSQREGFGLPPAEAMKAGCIVVGYAGVGGSEYLTPETGIPVPDSDFAALIEAVRATALEYDRAPARLDALRRAAAERIAERYSPERFRDSVLAAWTAIEARLAGGRGDGHGGGQGIGRADRGRKEAVA